MMSPRELVDHIRSGPAELVLDEALRFRRRTRSNPCDFNEFLESLQSSETIRDVTCWSQLHLGISEDEWVLLVKTLGSIKCIDYLSLSCQAGSRDFHPFQAVADAVKNAKSLHTLEVNVDGQEFPSDSSGLTALANALREHETLQDFTWLDFVSRLQAGSVDLSSDLVLQALPSCPHLQSACIMTECGSARAIQNLLQLPSATYLQLALNTEHWLAIADGIGQGHCNIEHLYLALQLQSSNSKDTEAVKAIASAIRLDCNLESLELHMQKNITDEAGVALAEALTVNQALREITLSFEPMFGGQVQDTDAMSAPAYNAFSAMLRVNTNLVLKVPPFNDGVGDERLVDSRNQMRIEQSLNAVGRGRLLSSSQTPRKEWVDALDELKSKNLDETPEFNVSCLYSLLRLSPAICMLKLDGITSNPIDFKS
jgi:hypothetical protein